MKLTAHRVVANDSKETADLEDSIGNVIEDLSDMYDFAQDEGNLRITELGTFSKTPKEIDQELKKLLQFNGGLKARLNKLSVEIKALDNHTKAYAKYANRLKTHEKEVHKL